MKKTSKFKSKKYPRLKKYAYGDTVDGGMNPMTVPEDPAIKPYYAPAESAAITEQKKQQQQLQQQKNQSNASDAVAIGGAVLKGGMDVYNTQNNPNASSEQKGRATRDAVYGVGTAVGGAIAPPLGTAMGLIDSGSKMVRASADKTNSEGQLVNKGGSQVAGAAGAFLDPAGALIELQSDPNATDVEKVAGALTGGYSEMFSGRHQRQVESDAKANIEAQAAAKKSYDEQVASQQAQQQAYMNQQIQSGIDNNYYAKYGGQMPSQRFAMGGIPQMPNSEVENDEFVTSQTAPIAYEGGGFKMASNNPAPGGMPTYESVGRTHSNGGIIAKLEDGGEAAPAHINGKTDDPRNKKNIFALAGKKFKDTMRNITNQERYNTKKLESGSKEAKSAANLMLPILAKAKIETNQLQKIVMDADQAIKDAKKYRNEIYKNGGQLPVYDEEAVEYKDGGIYIKPENRGKFTAYKERTGKTTAEALHSPNAHVRQMANFARNAAKWKHEMGGMQGLPKYDGGGYSDASGSYDSQGNMIAGPMGEILNDSQLSNMSNYIGDWKKEIDKEYQDAWDSGVDFDTRYDNRENQRKTPQDFIFNYSGSKYFDPLLDKLYDINKTENSVSPTLPVASTQPVTTSVPVNSNVVNTNASQEMPFKDIGSGNVGPVVSQQDVPEYNSFYNQEDEDKLKNLPGLNPSNQYIPTNRSGSVLNNPYSSSSQYAKDKLSGQQSALDKIVAPGSYNQNYGYNSLKNNNQNKVKPDPKDYSNYADYAREAAIFAGQNIGNISDLIRTRGGRKYDRESYGQMTPQMPDYTEAKRNAKSEASAYRRMLPGLTGGNAGATLGMMGQLQGLSQQALAKITEGEQQARTGVYNQFLPLNKQLEIQQEADTKANKARSEDIARMATSGIAATIGGAGSDYGMSKSDQEKLDLISKAYPDYNYNKRKKAWYHKNTNEKLDPTKVQAATTATK